MSVTDDSFIVLEETPSMLQFSLLDTSVLDTGTITKSIDTSTLEINRNELAENSTKCIDKIKDSIADLSFAIPSTSVNNGSYEKVLNDVDDHQQKQTPPKTTLAQSFLLGDINCDKMKVSNFSGIVISNLLNT